MRRLTVLLCFLVASALQNTAVLCFAQTPKAVVADVTVEPEPVAPGAQFAVHVTVSYVFYMGKYDTRVSVTDATGSTIPGGAYQFDQLTKSGQKTYDFTAIRAPAYETTWKLRATVEYRYVSTMNPNQVFTNSGQGWYKDFDVRVVPPKFTLTITSAPKSTVRVSANAYPVDAAGRVAVAGLSQGQYSVELQEIVSVDSGTRYVFKGWRDGDTSNPRIVVLSQNLILDAVYQKQFYLSVESPYGKVSGSGWYPEAERAQISVDPTSFPIEGIIGTLGGRMTFARWAGDLDSQSLTATVHMDGPRDVTAQWAADMGPLYLNVILIVIVIAIAAIAVFLATRKRRPPPTPLITGTGYTGAPVQTRPMQTRSVLSLKVQTPPATHCESCGAALPWGATKCPSCGTPAKK